MNEYLNVLEVDKLPLDAMDRFLGIDVDGNIKTASIIVDSVLDDASNNAISNKVVASAIRNLEIIIGDIDIMLIDIIG